MTTYGLSPAEERILFFAATSWTTPTRKQIAKRFKIAPSTVHKQVRSIIAKVEKDSLRDVIILVLKHVLRSFITEFIDGEAPNPPSNVPCLDRRA